MKCGVMTTAASVCAEEYEDLTNMSLLTQGGLAACFHVRLAPCQTILVSICL